MATLLVAKMLGCVGKNISTRLSLPPANVLKKRHYTNLGITKSQSSTSMYLLFAFAYIVIIKGSNSNFCLLVIDRRGD